MHCNINPDQNIQNVRLVQMSIKYYELDVKHWSLLVAYVEEFLLSSCLGKNCNNILIFL